MIDIPQAMGFAGMCCVVLAYYMVSTQRWLPTGVVYNWINLVGAILLIISLFFHFNLGSFVIEIFWIAIAVNGLRRHYFA